MCTNDHPKRFRLFKVAASQSQEPAADVRPWFVISSVLSCNGACLLLGLLPLQLQQLMYTLHGAPAAAFADLHIWDSQDLRRISSAVGLSVQLLQLPMQLADFPISALKSQVLL